MNEVRAPMAGGISKKRQEGHEGRLGKFKFGIADALILDIASLTSDIYDIGKALYERVSYQSGEENKRWYQSPLKISIALTVSAAILISFIITSYAVYHNVQPGFDISKLFHAIKKPSDVIGYTISWSIPTIQQFTHWVLLNRMIANLILAAMPNQIRIHRTLYLLSATAQTYSLVNISKLFWIKIEKPFSARFWDQGELLECKGVMKLEFFVPPLKPEKWWWCDGGRLGESLTKYLQATAKEIHDYITKQLEILSLEISERPYFKIHGFEIAAPKLFPIEGGGQPFLDKASLVLTEPRTLFFTTTW